ncbi:MAG: glycoside hydrolase family 92 protein [Bacteroidetes bacterium]|nr:MAG: glycoside hydrolase family 92 protein [Bacteroidota bacterium]
MLIRFSIFCVLALSVALASAPSKRVNPFIGTGGHGHTFPGAAVPFGMVQLSPDTRYEGWDACGGYHYSDSVILGFSHTHLSGTGIADYGDILIMPTVGNIEFSNYAYQSRFNHKKEKASPGYYSVQLETPNVFAEMTATTRVGMHRYSYPKTDSANIIIDLVHGLGPDKVLDSKFEFVSEKEIAGYRFSEGWAKNQKIFFVAQFSKPCKAFAIAERDTITPFFPEARGEQLKMFLRFSTKDSLPLLVKVGISSVSIEGARNNIKTEIPDWDFDAIKKKAETLWNQELSNIEIEGGTNEQLTTFYSALYHAMIAPNIYNDVDGQYRGMDGKIHKAEGFDMYTVFSLWDTFRAEHPLLTIIDQKRTLDFIKSFLARYDESGTLPVWEFAANETWCMIGYHSIPVIVDAYMRRIRGFDAEKALTAMLASANADRYGLKYYKTHGYIPGEKEESSVSKTLEYAYDDWCIAQFAKALGNNDVYQQFSERAQYYKNMFDPVTGFMRARTNGMWATPFEPTSVTFHYTEANAWQYNFFAPHDVSGLMQLMGGKEQFNNNLDSLFGTSSRTTGREQADISGMLGQYAQGNEPSHHFAYLYNYSGEPWKTQKTTRLIMDSLFTDKPDGICGNDDCGQMSAWYVMSAMGFYQACPGDPTYAVGSPLFKKITIHLENGNSFVIEAQSNSDKNKYITSASLNGKAVQAPFLAHDDMMKGGTFALTMSSTPNTEWGSSYIWHSKDEMRIAIVPYIEAKGKVFRDTMTIQLATPTPGANIYYTLDGSPPTRASHLYNAPIFLTQTTTVSAFAVAEGRLDSKTMQAEFIKTRPLGKLTLQTRYDAQYTGGGDSALIDGLRGGTDFRSGEWQGYHEVDLNAIVDLEEVKAIKRVALSCLQDQNSWIFFPLRVELTFSEDGITFGNSVTINNEISPREEGALLKEFSAMLSSTQARFIKVAAKNMGICPDWHKGKGSQAWLFVDEIVVE